MNQSIFKKDLDNNKILVTRKFAGTVEKVWAAWTQPEILDQWWAPRPWKAKTKSLDLRPGGEWLYCMEGPDGTQSWCKATYKTVEPLKGYEGDDNFCDENGNPNASFPSMNWKVAFMPVQDGTKVEIEITFANRADLDKIVEMGFEQGFTAAHGNLDELLAK